MRSKQKHRQYNLKYYHNNRNKLIKMMGGRCAKCGGTANLEFDHIDSSIKSFGISKCLQYGPQYLIPELDKCQLLCHACHKQKSKNFKDERVLIDADIANKLCQQYALTDLTQQELGDKYGISARTVSSVINGQRWSSETKATRQLLMGKRIRSTTLKTAVDKIDPSTGQIIETYSSMKQAQKAGYKSGAISRCCSGGLKRHRGFIWQKHKTNPLDY